MQHVLRVVDELEIGNFTHDKSLYLQQMENLQRIALHRSHFIMSDVGGMSGGSVDLNRTTVEGV